MKSMIAIVLSLALIGTPRATDLQSMDCWTNCSSCKSSCDGDSCQNMCESINRVCCGAAGKRPYLSGCGCHSE